MSSVFKSQQVETVMTEKQDHIWHKTYNARKEGDLNGDGVVNEQNN